MVRAVKRGMLRRTEEEIPYLGLDEKSFEKGDLRGVLIENAANM